VLHCRSVQAAIAAHEQAVAGARKADRSGSGPMVTGYVGGFHAVLVDVTRDEAGAQMLVRELTERNLLLPVVALCESKDSANVVKAMRMGCVDYLLAPSPSFPRARGKALCALRLGLRELHHAERALAHYKEADAARESSEIAQQLAGVGKLAGAQGTVSDEQAEAVLFASVSSMHHSAIHERLARRAAQRVEAIRAIGERHAPASARETKRLLGKAFDRRRAEQAAQTKPAPRAEEGEGGEDEGYWQQLPRIRPRRAPVEVAAAPPRAARGPLTAQLLQRGLGLGRQPDAWAADDEVRGREGAELGLPASLPLPSRRRRRTTSTSPSLSALPSWSEVARVAAHVPSSLLSDYGVASARDNAELQRPQLLLWRDALLASPTRKLTPNWRGASRSPAVGSALTTSTGSWEQPLPPIDLSVALPLRRDAR